MSRIASLSLLGLMALASSAALATPASATAPSLVCQLSPSTSAPRPGACGTFRPATNYVIHNTVLNGPAGGYVWTTPAGATASAGCRSGAATCDLFVNGISGLDRDFVTSVAIPGSGTQSVTAVVPAVCRDADGIHLC